MSYEVKRAPEPMRFQAIGIASEEGPAEATEEEIAALKRAGEGVPSPAGGLEEPSLGRPLPRAGIASQNKSGPPVFRRYQPTDAETLNSAIKGDFLQSLAGADLARLGVRSLAALPANPAGLRLVLGFFRPIHERRGPWRPRLVHATWR